MLSVWNPLLFSINFTSQEDYFIFPSQTSLTTLLCPLPWWSCPTQYFIEKGTIRGGHSPSSHQQMYQLICICIHFVFFFPVTVDELLLPLKGQTSHLHYFSPTLPFKDFTSLVILHHQSLLHRLSSGTYIKNLLVPTNLPSLNTRL